MTERTGGSRRLWPMARRGDYYYNQQWQMVEADGFSAQAEPTGSQVYVWSQRDVDAPVLRDSYDYDSQEEEYVLDADARQYYTGDANYNVTAVLDYTGAVQSRNVYDAYGKATAYDDAWSNAAAPAEDGPLYCGYFFDAESGNYLARNRYYNSSLATWISRDPIGYDAGDANLYRYVNNNPVIYVDPEGLKACKLMIFPGHDYEAKPWVEAALPDCGDGCYMGVVSCGSLEINNILATREGDSWRFRH